MPEPIPPGRSFAYAITNNLHLATLLGSCGCKPVQIVRGPEKTPQGMDVVKWVFESSPTADELIALWKNPFYNSPDFAEMTVREKKIIVEYVAGFAANLKHYLAHTKEKPKG